MRIVGNYGNFTNLISSKSRLSSKTKVYSIQVFYFPMDGKLQSYHNFCFYSFMTTLLSITIMSVGEELILKRELLG
jgi:hypothetical protein